MQELRAAVAAAQADPKAARRLWSTFAAFARTASTANRLRQDLIDAGVPQEYLPTRQEIVLLCSAHQRGLS